MHDGGSGHHGAHHGGHHGGHHSADGGQSFVPLTGSRVSANGWYARWRLPLLLVVIAACVVIAVVSH